MRSISPTNDTRGCVAGEMCQDDELGKESHSRANIRALAHSFSLSCLRLPLYFETAV